MSISSNEIRQKFFDFFESKGHKIVPSAPIVVKNDPTLMFTNAGMNQFKDFFLGNKESDVTRVADTQKCLRVSGKHNDLEEVGVDSYHHTMFEMLGNWSFGDYFKEEAIGYAWELLTEVYKLDKSRLYITVFGGDEKDGLEKDGESFDIWNKKIDKDNILFFDKKDNFWEMGETGPCGPCSEIHIDLRSDEDRAILPAQNLVNQDHPLVIEIWNLVFIQFNRKANGDLESLPAKHVDTGMGFERLTMALQSQKSNYDSDIFSPFIELIEKKTGITYTHTYSNTANSDTAMRVIVDHIRAIAFTIADGELPSNTGAGYVIRRILRRAVRYYYSFLNIKEPFLHSLIPMLAEKFKDVFPELHAQKDFVGKVILEEEKGFLRTLESGLKRIEGLDIKDNEQLAGSIAFELYDTYGFPIDLTRLIAQENSWSIDEDGFRTALQAQKDRARADAARTTGDWQDIAGGKECIFIGYDHQEVIDAKVQKTRVVEEKGNKLYQIVLNKTPFYAEGGGQVGDRGHLEFEGEFIKVLDTKKENDLIIHYVESFPKKIEGNVVAKVDTSLRKLSSANHSATHLLHAALKQVLGDHVNQKGSLVNEEILRFDFSHFQKMTDDEIYKVNTIVNSKIRENIAKKEDRSISIKDAEAAGAMMLFGEKYGDQVRMITFDPSYSIELCGGIHVSNTGEIGFFKITSETGIAAGVRRITAITSVAAETYINKSFEELTDSKSLFKNPNSLTKNIENLQNENKALKKQLEAFMSEKASGAQSDLKNEFQEIKDVNLLVKKLDISDGKAIKTLAFNLEKEKGNAIILFGNQNESKASLQLLISKSLTEQYGLNAGTIIRDIAKNINGGGGGQNFYASAGGSDPDGIEAALDQFKELINNYL